MTTTTKYGGPEPDAFYDRWHAITRAWALDGSMEGGTLWHTCEDGHRWREQSDGGVSPSYGLAGTSIKFPDWDPQRCPEPERHAVPGDDLHRIGLRCAECGDIRLDHDYLPGCSSSPWHHMQRFRDTGHVCEPPAPGRCGKPPVESQRWQKATLTDAQGKPYKGWTWVPVTVDQVSTVEEPSGQLGLLV